MRPMQSPRPPRDGALRACILAGLLSACSSGPSLTREELLSPDTCKGCHPDHYREWSGSMHAYAADDPVFMAMNARGQRETGGELGDFCVRCHAPMALLEGATTDGLDLADAPQHLKGVTCYFCHSVDAVEGTHNNPLLLADDGVMRGGISDPDDNKAHDSTGSPLHDRESRESSDMCGACHDVVTPAGVHLERTFTEWQDSLFGQDGLAHISCSGCHMTGRDGRAADQDGAPARRVHEHTFAGVDVALTQWPEKEAQLEAIRRDLDPSLQAELCVNMDPGPVAQVTLDNVLVGHMWPSGAAQDRRAWVELVAYIGDEVIHQSGVVDEGQPVASLADPDLWLMRDRALDAEGEVAHMFWDVAEVESELLPPAVTSDPADPRYFHAVTRSYLLPGLPDRVTMRVHLEPIGLDVMDDLIASGDLDRSVRDAAFRFTVGGTDLEWTTDVGVFNCVR